MRWLVLTLAAILVVVAFSFFASRSTDEARSPASLRLPTPDSGTTAPNGANRAGDIEGETERLPLTRDPERTSVQPYSEPAAVESRSSAEELRGSWVDFQPDSGVIDFEALQQALDAESIDTNWGPLMEAAVMGSTSKNQASLLSLTVTCKTTICGVEVRQAGTPEEGLPDNEVESAFFEWFGELGDSVIATDLGYWRTFLGGVDAESEVTTWRVWVLRTPPLG